ncbi:MAG: FixH family protein [Bacteroidia bacterium]
MKLNFGTGLFIGAVMFMIFVVVMVVKIMQADVPLVEDNYYEKGIKYQQTIDNSFYDDKLNIKLTEEKFKNSVKKLLLFNKSTKGDTIFAKAKFYRPSDKNKDFSIDVMLADTIYFPFDVSKFEKGLWRVKLFYNTADNKEYFNQQEFIF